MEITKVQKLESTLEKQGAIKETFRIMAWLPNDYEVYHFAKRNNLSTPAMLPSVARI